MPDAPPQAPAQEAAPAAPPATPPAAAAPPTPPEKPLSPIERAARAWDNIHTAAAARAKEKEKAAAATPPTPAAAPGPASTPPAPEAKPKEEEPLSAKFAQLARLERQAREGLKAAKAEREAFAKQQAEWQAKLDAYEKARAGARLDVDAWLQHGGLTYDDVANWQLAGKKPTPELAVAAVRDELSALKKAQEEERRKATEAETERAKTQHAAQYTAWQRGVIDFVKANASKYELTVQQGAFELVPAVIQQRFEESSKSGKPVILSEADAADLVEKHLEEQAEKLLTTEKLKAKLKPPEPAQPAQPPRQPTPPTLTNGLTASASSGGKPRSWAERMKAAALAMEKAQAPK